MFSAGKRNVGGGWGSVENHKEAKKKVKKPETNLWFIVKKKRTRGGKREPGMVNPGEGWLAGEKKRLGAMMGGRIASDPWMGEEQKNKTGLPKAKPSTPRSWGYSR